MALEIILTRYNDGTSYTGAGYFTVFFAKICFTVFIVPVKQDHQTNGYDGQYDEYK
jgi:hypothetical protein